MKANQLIRSLAAGLMLLLFAISIAPKLWLHDFFSGHKHSYAQDSSEHQLRDSKSSIQCNWDRQLIDSPFTGEPSINIEHPLVVHFSPLAHYTFSVYTTAASHTSLRGPPAIA
ncbi:MAG: hypothetical protein JNN00_11550 [Chitinophagaceae bacterium]|nr:hypothetical protein [Chitinophagaceae bacterium]